MEREEAVAEQYPGADALDLTLRPERLTVGLAELTVSWMLDLRNVGDTHLVALRIWSDMTGVQGGMQARKQLEGAQGKRASLHRIGSLFPGAKGRIKGEWRFPLADIPPVEGARAIVVLPMVRFRFVGAGFAPFRTAFLIGLPPEPGSGRLKPVRLDEGTKTLSRVVAKRLG